MGEGFLVQPGRGAGRGWSNCPNGFSEWSSWGQATSRGPPPSCVPPSSCAPRACGDAWERPIIRFLNRFGQRVSPPTRFSFSDRLPAARRASPVMPLSSRRRQWTGGSRVAGQIAWESGEWLCLPVGGRRNRVVAVDPADLSGQTLSPLSLGALEAIRALGRRPSSRRHTPNSRCPNTEGRAENQPKGRVHLVAVHCDHPERGGNVEDAHQGDKLFGKGPDSLAPPSPKQKESGAARQPRSASGALKAP